MKLPLYLTADEVDFMLQALKTRPDPFKLTSALKELKQRFADDAERLKEISARCRTNQYWERDLHEEAQEKAVAAHKTKRVRRDKVVAGIKALSPQEQSEILAALRGKV